MKRISFTIIELLIVISIIAILAAMLMPALNKAKETARGIQCTNNLKSLAVINMQYSIDNKDFLIPAKREENGALMTWHDTLILKALYRKLDTSNKLRKKESVLICPSDHKKRNARYEYINEMPLSYAYQPYFMTSPGRWRWWTDSYRNETKVELHEMTGKAGKIKNTSKVMMFGDIWRYDQLTNPAASSVAVPFLVQYKISAGKLNGVNYAAHSDGMKTAFADGHAAPVGKQGYTVNPEGPF